VTALASPDAERGPAPSAPVSLPFLAVVFLLFASSAVRLPGSLLFPSFWAEDGTVFFRDSVEKGASAILTPLFGSHLLLIRLIAFLISLFPTFWAPALFAVSAGLLASVSLALFSRAGYRWLLPDDRLRVLVCWLFSLAPGTTESFFALSPGTYAVVCGLFFLLLERDGAGRWQMGIGRALLVSFLWFSVAQGLVLAAPIAYLFWRTRNRNYLLCLATLVAMVLLNLTADNAFRPEHSPGAGVLARVYLENVAIRLGFVPLLPQRWFGFVRELRTAPFLLLSTILLGGYVWRVVKERVLDPEGARVLAVAVLSAMALFPMTALARSYGLTMLSRPEIYLAGRAALIPSVLALLLLWLWLARPRGKGLRQAAALALLAWSTFCLLFEPLYQPSGAFRPFIWEWPLQARTIEEALRARRSGGLREAVVLGSISCRPDSRWWKINGLTIAPEGRISSSGQPPPPR
jgi:hypothetical protein